MAKLLDINRNKPHEVCEVICVKCGYRYISVHPTDVLLKNLECPNCGNGYIIKTGQNIEMEE